MLCGWKRSTQCSCGEKSPLIQQPLKNSYSNSHRNSIPRHSLQWQSDSWAFSLFHQHGERETGSGGHFYSFMTFVAQSSLMGHPTWMGKWHISWNLFPQVLGTGWITSHSHKRIVNSWNGLTMEKWRRKPVLILEEGRKGSKPPYFLINHLKAGASCAGSFLPTQACCNPPT